MPNCIVFLIFSISNTSIFFLSFLWIFFFALYHVSPPGIRVLASNVQGKFPSAAYSFPWAHFHSPSLAFSSIVFSYFSHTMIFLLSNSDPSYLSSSLPEFHCKFSLSRPSLELLILTLPEQSEVLVLWLFVGFFNSNFSNENFWFSLRSGCVVSWSLVLSFLKILFEFGLVWLSLWMLRLRCFPVLASDIWPNVVLPMMAQWQSKFIVILGLIVLVVFPFVGKNDLRPCFFQVTALRLVPFCFDPVLQWS